MLALQAKPNLAARSTVGVSSVRSRSGAARARAPLAVSAEAPKWNVVPPTKVNSLINDKGYTFLDIRTGNEYRKGSGLHWMHLPLAEEVDDDVIMNPNFKAIFDKKFVNKMSRVIIACQDGGRRSEIAAEMVTGMGYTAIAVVEGGVEAYLKVSPLKEADLRPRVKRVQQEVGIKYGGTGVTSEQTPDDSA